MEKHIENDWLSRTGIQQILITPEIAESMLQYNTNNRPIRKSHLLYLVQVMKNGEWIPLHPNPIAFSNKRLINGSHRLSAIYLSKVTCLCWCSFGLNDNIFPTIDNHASRSYAERFHYFDKPKQNRAAMSLITEYSRLFLSGSYKRPTKTDIDMIWKMCGDWISYCSDKMVTKAVPARAFIWIALGLYYKKYNKLGIEFIENYIRPDGLVQQAQMLRDWAFRNATSFNYEPHRYANFSKVLYACHCHLENIPIQKLICLSRIKVEEYTGIIL